MLYAILAYHDEKLIVSMSAQEDAALMADLMRAHDRINEKAKLGPAARLDFTGEAVTLRDGPDRPVTDGPFAETKEQLLGFYVVDVETPEQAVEAARELRRVNPTAVYEIRPIRTFLPGTVPERQ
ncbi:MAG: YciI family protein [Rhizobiaceae bacterium]|nr:YciI family protein [Rhizobiaceae bacterium]MCV0406944.1 YciI family protein [Rhizobiaceae bacterium]